MSLLDSFLIRAALAGVGAALSGCSWFGEATAHVVILSVALSLALHLPVLVGVLAVSPVMAALVSTLSGRGHAVDTLLGVLAHSALAVGLAAASFVQGVRIALMAHLFGDILAVGRVDLAVIWGGGLLVLGLLAWNWPAFLTSTLNPDLAYAPGIDPKREELVLTLALALAIAVAIKVVGMLSIAALLIMPAVAARPFAATPERMAVIATCLGALSALGGLWVAWQYETLPSRRSCASRRRYLRRPVWYSGARAAKATALSLTTVVVQTIHDVECNRACCAPPNSEPSR